MSKKDVMQEGIQEFIDKCTARWLFEKTGTELYDKALEKCPEDLRDQFQEFRDQEKSHEEMLEDVIRKYGADPHTMTPSARITQIESTGLVNVINNEDFKGVLDALLAIELVDNANWELLIELADQINDDDSKDLFEDALDEEEEHLKVIQEQVVYSTMGKLDRFAA